MLSFEISFWIFNVILSHPQQHLRCFEGFTTKKHYNVRKWYLTGCEHFWDPVLEMRYNNFAGKTKMPSQHTCSTATTQTCRKCHEISNWFCCARFGCGYIFNFRVASLGQQHTTKRGQGAYFLRCATSRKTQQITSRAHIDAGRKWLIYRSCNF